jgi:hypothetical protein
MPTQHEGRAGIDRTISLHEGLCWFRVEGRTENGWAQKGADASNTPAPPLATSTTRLPAPPSPSTGALKQDRARQKTQPSELRLRQHQRRPRETKDNRSQTDRADQKNQPNLAASSIQTPVIGLPTPPALPPSYAGRRKVCFRNSLYTTSLGYTQQQDLCGGDATPRHPHASTSNQSDGKFSDIPQPKSSHLWDDSLLWHTNEWKPLTGSASTGASRSVPTIRPGSSA